MFLLYCCLLDIFPMHMHMHCCRWCVKKMVCDCSAVGGWWLRDCVCDESTRSQKNKTTTPITTPITITTIIYGTVKIACRVRRMRACALSTIRLKITQKNRQTQKTPKKQTHVCITTTTTT